jgi:D-amino-acid dehydrogenase
LQLWKVSFLPEKLPPNDTIVVEFMNHPKSEILIIGAGIIGLSCAYELSKQGVSVTVIDKSEPGSGCSYGNAGWITPCFALPLPMPGMLAKSLKWLLNPISPLYIKPEVNWLLISWLLRFLRSTHAKTAARSTSALMDMAKFSLKEYTKLSQELELPFGFEKKGLLMVSQTTEGLNSMVQSMELVSNYGIPSKFLNEADLKTFEPSLTGTVKGGVYFSEEAHCEPLDTVKAIAQAARKNGVNILSGIEAYDFEISNRKIGSVRTTHGSYVANQFILATGSWSTPIANRLGIPLPLLGGKGYAITLKPFTPAPKIPIMITEKKVAITPRANSIRIAGTLELVDQDYSITSRRVDAILNGAQQYFNIPKDPEILELWRGLRPCTPDGVPVIGYSKKYSNLFLCTGHQMLGLKSAPGTARLASDLILGTQPIFDPAPLSPDRF